jgi:Response regulators consisting of a CheY-like receiver domain and a winged-helix DNA-binding domain
MVTTPKVLIIDDSNTECVLMGQALQRAGYQVLIANDGIQGLRLLSLESPQCLVLDIVLPGMSGYDVCRQLRAQDSWRDLPIVMVSTKNSSADLYWARRQGANHYLAKPFKGEALVQVVDEMLAKRVQRAGTSPKPQFDAFSANANAANVNAAPRLDKETPPPRTAQATSPFQPLRRSPALSSSPTGSQPNTGLQPDPLSGSQRPSSDPNATERARNSDSFPLTGRAAGGTGSEYGLPRPADMQDMGGTGSYRLAGGSLTPPAFQGIPGLTENPQRPTANRPTPSMNDVRSQTRSGPQPTPNLFMRLIPRRSEHAEMLWSGGPDALFIADRLARQLYLAIDGKSDVGQLCVQTGLAKEDVFKALRILISQQRIQLFDVQGRKMDGSFLQ